MKIPDTGLSKRQFLRYCGVLGLAGSWPLSLIAVDRNSPVRRTGIPAPSHYLITRWRQDPWALGSYSYLAVGSRSLHRRQLAEPLGRAVFFAGEATSSDFPSTVHGALLSGRRAAKEVMESGAGNVAVIGSGMAGMGAAQQLAEKGIDCVIFEARNRVGGRVWTNQDLGVPIDAGASWIHGVRGNPLSRMAQSLGVKTIATDYDDLQFYDHQGESLRLRDTPRSFQEVAFYEHDYGADLSDLSPQAFDEGEEFGGEEVIFPNGYAQLFPGLQGEYEIRLSSPVSQIIYDQSSVELIVNGDSQRFDAVIVTVPLGVLKAGSIAFSPELPVYKRQAISRLGMGLLNKVCLRFDEVFWDEDVTAIGFVGRRRGRFSMWLNMARYINEPVLIAFNSGSAAEAIEKNSDNEIIAEAMEVLSAMYSN